LIFLSAGVSLLILSFLAASESVIFRAMQAEAEGNSLAEEDEA